MRADRYLVANGFFDTRARAQAAIKAGRVTVDGAPVSKPSQSIPEGAAVGAAPAHPWVSRAGLKLEAALEAFGIDPAGRHCLDIGASTGGFAEVLLERGAARVVAVDVGRDQLHASLRDDPRVVSLERTDARELTAATIGEAPSLVTCDASFIALEKVLDRPLSLAAPDADLVALFKPQFQVGRSHVGKGGIVSDPDAVEAAKARLGDWLGERGWRVESWTESPVRGGDGNVEHLFLARRREPG